MLSDTGVKSHMGSGRNREIALCHDVKSKWLIQCSVVIISLTVEWLVLFLHWICVSIIQHAHHLAAPLCCLAGWGSKASPLFVHVCCPLQTLWNYPMQMEILSLLHRVHLFVSTEQLLFQWLAIVLSKGLLYCHHKLNSCLSANKHFGTLF